MHSQFGLCLWAVRDGKPARLSIPWLLTACLMLAQLLAQSAAASAEIPQLRRIGDVTQLVVDGRPYLVRGGELGNSSSSSAAYMAPIWPRLAAMHLNTVLLPVYWELIEPEEGQFDFALLDDMIDQARAHGLKLVLLWFGSWKNSMSSYVPPWVKLDEQQFPRARDEQGRGQEILTAFSDANRHADRSAYLALLQHLQDHDARQHTVIMIQVENEVAMLPSARDHHPLADAAFARDVPRPLLARLAAQQAVPGLHATWQAQGARSTGSWREVFGDGDAAAEIFMAWHFARYVDDIAASGKEVYPLPVFVNAALNGPGAKPGRGYPSGGPLPHLMDVWQLAAPAIDFLSPDFYNPDFRHWSDLYTRSGNPLFVPEHRFDATAAAKALFTFGHYQGIGFAPFSIETGDETAVALLREAYGLIDQLDEAITSHHGQGRVDGVLLNREHQEAVLRFGRYQLVCRHDYTLGWSAEASKDGWPAAAAIVIQLTEDSFLFAGNGVVVAPRPADDDAGKIGILRAEEGEFVAGAWRAGRRLNGDQTHQGRHLRLPTGTFATQRFELYSYGGDHPR